MKPVAQDSRCFGAPYLGTGPLSSQRILVCFRGCIIGSPCIRLRGSWRAGVSAWPRGGELREKGCGGERW